MNNHLPQIQEAINDPLANDRRMVEEFLRDNHRLIEPVFRQRCIDWLNNHLSPIQLEDRRRVEALLEDAETVSLQDYFYHAWLENDPLYPVTIHVEANNAATANDRGRLEALLEDAKTPSLRQRCIDWLNSNPAQAPEDMVACCSSGCWKDLNLSIWDTLQHRPQCVPGHFHAILHHHKQRSRLAFGVACEEFNKEEFYGHDQSDHYMQGREVPPENMEGYIWYRNGSEIPIKESDIRGMKQFFGDPYQNSALPTVNEVTSAGGSIIYDILFLGSNLELEIPGETQNNPNVHTQLRNERTAKGTMNLTFEGNHLKGTVELDSRMESLDAAPFGGNFSWTEHSRWERITSTRQSEQAPWNHTSTSYLSMTSQVNSTEFFNGNLRVIGQRTAMFLAGQQVPPLEDRTSAAVLDLAARKMNDYNIKGCLWMHRHTDLPLEVIHRINAFVSPPPVLYLEKGDLVLEMDWGSTVFGTETLLAHRIYGAVQSIIIARRRKMP